MCWWVSRTPKGMVDVVLSYCHNTLNDTTLADLLPYFKEKGVGVISASCTSMGMFTKQARSTADLPPFAAGNVYTTMVPAAAATVLLLLPASYADVD